VIERGNTAQGCIVAVMRKLLAAIYIRGQALSRLGAVSSYIQEPLKK